MTQIETEFFGCIDVVMRRDEDRLGVTGVQGGGRSAKPSRSPHRAALRSDLQRLYADLAGPLPTTACGAQYCLIIVYIAANMDWSIFLPDKSAATVTHSFRLATFDSYGKLREADMHRTQRPRIHQQRIPIADGRQQHPPRVSSVDGPKHNGLVERRLAVVAVGGKWQRCWSFTSCLMAWSFRARHSTWAHITGGMDVNVRRARPHGSGG